MEMSDLLRLAFGSVFSYRFRSMLTALGIAIGIAAVVLLTSIGEGIHRFVLAEFSQFGTHILAISPGKTMTHGASPGMFGTTRPLTIDDAEALRRVPQILASVPVVQGTAKIKSGNASRDTTVLGVGADTLKVWSLKVELGEFLPQEDPRSARAFVVLGHKVWQELFAGANPVGARVQVGDERYRVIGVMESKGQILGFDMDDAVYIPTSKAQSMFNRESVMEIDLLYAPQANVQDVIAAVSELLIQRHNRDDFTIITQEEMLDVLSSVLDTITFAVAAIGGISLLVGGIGVLTIMTIAVNERTSEVGLLRALGARRSQILWLFLTEAIVLALVGGVAGLCFGIGGALLLDVLIPALPVNIAWGYVLASVLLSGAIGMIAGVVPAQRAARLDPVEALRTE
ncbi:MAG: ABC transporter permease [Pseudomonadota bacterium]